MAHHVSNIRRKTMMRQKESKVLHGKFLAEAEKSRVMTHHVSNIRRKAMKRQQKRKDPMNN